jgi:cytochrome o ubiquinol oxidase operon protein cyoD
MTHSDDNKERLGDSAPGDDEGQLLPSIAGYTLGLIFALGLTATSFWAASTHTLWAPGIPIGLCVLAIAQMGIHLAFFPPHNHGPR